MSKNQIGLGLYDLRECARLTGLDAKRVRRWFVPAPSEGNRRPVLTPDYPRVQGDTAISFLDMIEVFVLGNLREHHVPLQTAQPRPLRQESVPCHARDLRVNPT